MREAPSNTDNIINSRDVIKRIEELDAERDDLVDDFVQVRDKHEEARIAVQGAEDDKLLAVLHDKDIEKAQGVLDKALELVDEVREDFEEAEAALKEWQEEYGDELKALKTLADEGADYSGNWSCGETLIHEDYFVEYVKGFVEDIGDFPRDLPAYVVIDWEAIAENIKVDYTEIDFDGTTFLIWNS